jgi:D-glutamate N-acetyltransferase
MNQRLLILADGELGVFSAKTATSLIRYRPEAVAGVLDREHAGKTTRQVLEVPAAVPIVATLEEGLALGPDTLVIGIAPQGGQLPDSWREVIRGALSAGLSVLSGLHVFLGDNPEFAHLASRHDARIVDLRRPPEGQPIAHMGARETRALRVLTVGTDCNVGKMVAALEMEKAASARGLDARFVATGQTGMLIAGGGVTLDRIPGDFMAGFVEQMVLEAGEADLVLVEGQGCLLHPAYSGVTLALLHGSLPDAMVLVHHAGRRKMRNQDLEIPPLSEWVRRYEDALAPLHSGRVVGIALNRYGLTPDEAEAVLRRAEEETRLPAVDVVSGGTEGLVEAVLSLER